MRIEELPEDKRKDYEGTDKIFNEVVQLVIRDSPKPHVVINILVNALGVYLANYPKSEELLAQCQKDLVESLKYHQSILPETSSPKTLAPLPKRYEEIITEGIAEHAKKHPETEEGFNPYARDYAPMLDDGMDSCRNTAFELSEGPWDAFILLLSTAAALASMHEFSGEMVEAGVDIAFNKQQYAANPKN
jgi:hypothetical protein